VEDKDMHHNRHNNGVEKLWMTFVQGLLAPRDFDEFKNLTLSAALYPPCAKNEKDGATGTFFHLGGGF